jgi:dolichol-phosphate mannosyltransferase
MSEEPRLSVVSPVYHAEDCLEEFASRLGAALSGLTDSYEVILVDDGSLDGSWERIAKISRERPGFRGLRLSRNFGQHLAIAAGLAAARGKWVVVMDCDLQDPPELIRELVRKADEGYDVVGTIRRSRSASIFRRAASHAFYAVARVLSSPHVRPGSNTLSLISRKVVAAYLRAFDLYSPYPFIVSWLGFRATYIEIDHAPRAAGSSSYTLSKLFRFALNGLVSQSTRLLHISTVIGLLFSLMSVVQVVLIVYWRLTRTAVVAGWASLMAVLWLVGGTILFSLGVIGLYMTRLFEQTRNRPYFVVSDSTEDAPDVASRTLQESRFPRETADATPAASPAKR